MRLLKIYWGMILMIVFWLIVLYALDPSQRHYYGENDQVMVAWYVRFPGHEGIVHCEQKVDLRPWVGSRFDSLVAVNPDGQVNSEATAGLALLTTGLFPGHQLKQRPDGHYILYKPAETERYFTWGAWHQVWPGKPAKT